MCFSEEVSFVAAGALTVASAVCFYSARTARERYALATIPLFFALQQAAEGVQWLVFKGLWGSSIEAHSARDLFLFIAYAVWPFWIPFSLWVAEIQPARRYVLQWLLFLGLALAVYQGWKVLFFPIDAYVQHKSIYYDVDVTQIFLWPYLAASLFPWFVSSLRYTNLVGVILLLGVLASAYFYYVTFVSVWCFVAAIISVLLIAVVRSRNHSP